MDKILHISVSLTVSYANMLNASQVGMLNISIMLSFRITPANSCFSWVCDHQWKSWPFEV